MVMIESVFTIMWKDLETLMNEVLQFYQIRIVSNFFCAPVETRHSAADYINFIDDFIEQHFDIVKDADADADADIELILFSALQKNYRCED